MNTGVELLLKRMETHPEEFVVRVQYGASQWTGLISQFIDHLDEEDRNALEAGTRRCHQEVFTGKVMQSLAGEGESSDEGKFLTSSIGMGGATQGTWGNGLTTNALYRSAQAQQALVNTNNTGTVTLPSGSITLGGTTLSEAGLKQMLATHKAMREETKSKRWWNKTLPELFGKK